jgi:hypothetical protein
MEPCPFHKAGRHDLAAVLPEDSDHDMTLWCTACGALRRVPVSGSLSSSLDHLDADAIAAAVSRIP